jgi:hypothetical protein
MFANLQGLPNILKSDDHKRDDHSWGWIFALVIIFLVVIFFAAIFMRHEKRDGNVIGEVAPLAALAAMNQHKSHGPDHCAWDQYGETIRQGGENKFQIAEAKWALTREGDQNTMKLMEGQATIKTEIAASERRTADLIKDAEIERIKSERDAARLEASQRCFHPQHYAPYPYPAGA